MKYYFALSVLLGLMSNGFALDGQIGIHDPSTIMLCDGKYYTYGTGGSPLVSDDGWTWRRGVVPARTGAAPDVIHIGDRYYMYISGVTMISSKSLDPNSPDYKWEDGGAIVGKESPDDFMNPIDPGAFLDPNTGRLWLTYGSYFGYIRVAELDPKTGKRLHPDKQPPNIGVNLEATTMIYHDGWYYLLGTHGSCCRGADSGYNIRVGRSKEVTGPFLDDDGVDMLEGGGKLLITSGGRVVGPGHFGLMDLGDGVQKFSMHWEADLDRGGASVLDIRPLLWKDGWPVAGENMKEGTYEIESARTGTALELAVEGVPVGGRRGGRGGGFGGPAHPAQPAAAPVDLLHQTHRLRTEPMRLLVAARAVEDYSVAPVRQYRHRTLRKFRQTGLPTKLARALPIISFKRNRNGRLLLSRMQAGIPALLTSKSRLPGPTARWRQLPMANWFPFRASPRAGTTLAAGSAHRRLVARNAQIGGRRKRTARPFRHWRSFRDALQIRSS